MDFLSKKKFKLQQINPSTLHNLISPIILRGEEIISAYQTYSDYVIFTNRRVLTVVLERNDTTKNTLLTLPYSRILYFSIESKSLLENECVMHLYFLDLGDVEFEFIGSNNVARLSHIIGSNIFNFN